MDSFKVIVMCFVAAVVLQFCQANGTDQQCSLSCEEMRVLKEILNRERPRNCAQMYWLATNSTSVQNIYPTGPAANATEALCDTSTTTGDWTVIQRRIDGSVDFYQDWATYKKGFGSAQGEFWIGLDAMHHLTSRGDQVLRIELEDFAGNQVYAEYTTFIVGPESDNYRLKVGGYSGNAGDSLVHHNNNLFSTKDRDNDSRKKKKKGCAEVSMGGWWYNSCYIAHLNGVYFSFAITDDTGINWLLWKYKLESLKSVKMMIRTK